MYKYEKKVEFKPKELPTVKLKKKNVPDTPFQIVGKMAKRAVKDVKSVIKAPGKFVEGIVKRDEKIKNNQQARYEEEGKAANEAQSGFRYGIRKQK